MSHVRSAAWSAGDSATHTVRMPAFKSQDLDLMNGEVGVEGDKERALANGLREGFMGSGRGERTQEKREKELRGGGG